MRRLLFLNEYFPPVAPGGAEWSLLRLADALAARGHDVRVLTPDLGGEPVATHPRVRVERFPFPANAEDGRPLSPYRIANPLFYGRFARAALAAVAREPADLVHAQNVHSMPAAAAVQRRRGVPAIVTVRDFRMLCPSAICLMEQEDLTRGCGFAAYWRCGGRYRDVYRVPGGRWRRAKERARWTWEWADWRMRRRRFAELAGAVFVGERIRAIHERAGLAARLHATIRNLPPEPSTAHPDPAPVLARLGLAGRRIVLHAGRVSVGKGGRVLLAAARALSDAGPQVVFALAGRVELADPVPPDLADRFRLLGPLSRDDLRALYASAEVFVAASVWQEPFSRAILEAMDHGLPIVATDAGGNPEALTDGETGLIVPRSDPRALAEAVRRLLSDPALARRLGENARWAVHERFAVDASLNALEAFYDRVLEAAR